MTDQAVERVFPGADWQAASPESQGIDPEKLDEALVLMERIVNTKNHEVTHLDGIEQVMVIRHGYLVWQGPKIDAFHTAWSCTKSFPSLCMGLLTDDGKLSPDTVAADILPSLAENYPGVTLRQFASFTSGYMGIENGDTLKHFEPGPPAFKPDEFFEYSQATDMLAYLLTRVAGEPLRDLFRRRIAEPIGMDPDQWHWADWGEVDGIAVCGGTGMWEHGMHITARQMARVGWLLVNRGNWSGQQLVSEAYIDEMTTPQVPNTIPPRDPEGWYVRLPGSYGLNIWLNGVTPDGKRMWPDAPPRVAAIQGNMNNICFSIPEWDMVLVRLATDGRIDNDTYTEVFAAFGEALLD